jgi:RNA polymerase sigma-70 factor (sigma-E family)
MGVLRRGPRRYEDDFVAYYTDRGDSLRTTAYLLCGDWHLAEDLTQTVFTKLYQAWQRIERHDTLDRYARRALLNAFLDERRRPWRREYATLPGSASLDSVSHDNPGTDERLVLHNALLSLSRRHRAVLVLRFWHDLSVDQVADILGCSPGTVKSQTARGLAALRDVMGDLPADLVAAEGGRP